MSSFEGQLNIAPTQQLSILVLCCYLLSESNYGTIFFEVQPSSSFEPEADLIEI